MITIPGKKYQQSPIMKLFQSIKIHLGLQPFPQVLHFLKNDLFTNQKMISVFGWFY